MRRALAQYEMGRDVIGNLSKALELMRGASRQGAQLIIFPELCLSPFFPQFPGQDVSHYALRIGADPVQRFQALCRELHMAASPNIYLQEGNRLFDASLFIDSEGAILGTSKMVHIAQLPGFHEQDYYTPSDTGFRVYESALGKIGIVVCFDRHYPESVRTCALRGAQLVIIPTANTMEEPRDLFECELRTAAMQNGVYIAMCNRVGEEGQTTFCGESTVVAPDGNVLIKGSTHAELLVVDIDPARIEDARRRRPYISLRRPECYE
jgi:predicted amidohydrolase